MTETDFILSVETINTDEAVYDALTNKINKWWTEDFQGSASRLNDQFIVRFGNTYKEMQVKELIPNRKVVWKCIKSFIDMDDLKNKSEWTGTEIEWSILQEDKVSLVKVLHKGLNPEIGCYEACEKGWFSFVNDSLIPYLETGKGRPFM